jgi:hypothetical protein
MPVSWKKAILGFLQAAGRTLAVIAIVGGAQTVVSLLVWQMLFRAYPMGFSMGLSLVGFASWLLSFAMGLGGRRVYSTGMSGSPALTGLLSARKALDQPKDQLDRNGCGCLLFVASVIPLGIAFLIRVQADLSSGKSWQDIFPPIE